MKVNAAMIIYVTTQGSEIIKEGRHLIVKKDNSIYKTLFVHKLEQLVLFGNVRLSHSALVQLFRNKVDTVFLSSKGRFLGRLSHGEAKNVFLRKKQYTVCDDQEIGVKLTRRIVHAKLANMATILMRVQRTRKEAAAKNRGLQIRALFPLIEKAGTIASLRGYEGRGSALYFSAFGCGFIRNPGFYGRVRRPPTDPVNSVLSLVYTFLMNRMYTAVRLANLDPYPGFLHSLDYGRYSLVLDLMEEFRPIIADTLVLSLFNLGILKDNDFDVEKPVAVSSAEDEMPDFDVATDPIGVFSMQDADEKFFDLPEQRVDAGDNLDAAASGKHPVKLTAEALKKVINAFEKKLKASFFHPNAGKELSYEESLNYQAAQFRRLIEGEIDQYQPIIMK